MEMEMEQLGNYSQALHVAYTNIPQQGDPRYLQMIELYRARDERKDYLQQQKINHKQLLTDATRTLRTSKKTRKEAWVKRGYTAKPIRNQVYHIFKKYGITPQQYHGGDLVGNHCRILMGKSVEILEEIVTLLKSVPMENRRKRNISSQRVVTDDDLEQRCQSLSDLLTLADAVYCIAILLLEHYRMMS